MPRGIEHRDPDTLLSSFENYALIKWAIYSYQDQVMCYDGIDKDEALELLTGQLLGIQQSGTNNVYTLRVYPDTVNDINKKSAFKGSTTFMFGGAPVKNENGVVVIDRTAASNNYNANRVDALGLNNRVTTLENELATERELRHKAELANLRTEFTNKIAGLSEKEEPDKWISLAEKAIEKPDAIKEIMSGIGSFIDKFMNRVPPPPAETPAALQPAINGTEYVKTEFTMERDPEEEMHDQEHDTETEGEEEPLTPEQEAIMDRMDDAIDILEHKIGADKLVEALEALAGMSTIKLKGMLAML